MVFGSQGKNPCQPHSVCHRFCWREALLLNKLLRTAGRAFMRAAAPGPGAALEKRQDPRGALPFSPAAFFKRRAKTFDRRGVKTDYEAPAPLFAAQPAKTGACPAVRGAACKKPGPAPLFATQPVKKTGAFPPLFAAQPAKVFRRGLFSKRPEPGEKVAPDLAAVEFPEDFVARSLIQLDLHISSPRFAVPAADCLRPFSKLADRIHSAGQDQNRQIPRTLSKQAAELLSRTSINRS